MVHSEEGKILSYQFCKTMYCKVSLNVFSSVLSDQISLPFNDTLMDKDYNTIHNIDTTISQRISKLRSK